MHDGNAVLTGLCASLTVVVLSLVGCEQSAEPVIPAGPNPDTHETGQASGFQGRNSSLGKAKDTAESIVNQAEQQSQNIANQADGMANPDR